MRISTLFQQLVVAQVGVGDTSKVFVGVDVLVGVTVGVGVGHGSSNGHAEPPPLQGVEYELTVTAGPPTVPVTKQ